MTRCFARLMVATALGSFAIPGCQHSCRWPCSPAPPPALGKPFPLPQAVPQAPLSPVPAPAEIRGYEPPLATPAQPFWRPPADPGARLAPPGDAYSQPSPEGARLQPPDFTSPPPSKPDLGQERSPTPSLPVGIPQFAVAKDQVATGMRPSLDGIDWLKQNGFRAVLHVRQPGEDDAADRRLFEARGLKYLNLEVSPQSLSRMVVDDFNRIVGDRANHPLFIYDKGGALTGGLWYLHFRAIDRASDEQARAKATRLGLREDQNGLQREIWLAIQKYLGEQAR